MKYLKRFNESHDDYKEIDVNLFMDSFVDIIDEYDLSQVNKRDATYIVQGYGFLISENWYDGYFFNYHEPYDVKSNFHTQRLANFSANIVKKTIKNSNVKEYIGGDASKSLLMTEFPKLIEDINTFIETVINIHKSRKQSCKPNINVWLNTCRDFNFYHIAISFEVYTPKFHETPDGKTLNMLKSMDKTNRWSDDYRKRFKDIGFDIDESSKVMNITQEDVIKCIRNGRFISAQTIKGIPNNDDKELKPLSIDDDGLITALYNGKEYEVDIKNVKRVDIFNINESRHLGIGRKHGNMTDNNFKILTPDEDDEFRDSIINEVNDIVLELYDRDFFIDVKYGISSMGFETDTITFFISPNQDIHTRTRSFKFFETQDIQTVVNLDKFLVDEGFETIEKNILRETEVRFRCENKNKKGKLMSASISRLAFMIDKGTNVEWISFEYKIPNEIH